MAKEKRTSRNSATAKSERGHDVIDSLKPEESVQVLRRLLSLHPDLRAEAEQITGALLGTVSFEDTADAVEDAVTQFGLDDLNERAGAHSWGYTEPTEAAWELLDEAMEPFMEDMKRYLDLGLEKEALEVCKGIVLGLYQIRDRTADEFLGWAPDFPAEAATNALQCWLCGGGRKPADKSATTKRRVFPRDFIGVHVPEWREMLEGVLLKEPS